MSFHQDLDNMTRDMHDASLEVEYMQKTPVLDMILAKKNLKFNGGKYYYKEVDTDTTEDLAQDYSVNEPLTHGTKDTTETVKFGRKTFQIPVQIDMDEELQNALDNEDGTRLHDLAAFKVKKVNEAGRLHLRKLLYAGSNAGFIGSDSNKYMQGFNSALLVDRTYGGLTRTKASNINDWFQPADNNYDASGAAAGDQDGEYPISIDWLQQILDPLVDLENMDGDFAAICGNTLWMAIKAEAQARSMPVEIKRNKFAFGVQEMVIDDMKIIKDPFLQSKYNSLMGETTGSAGALERRLYAINVRDWQFMVHPKRYFKLTPWFDQKQIAGGSDFRLARLLFAGNLTCWHPNRSLYLKNVVA